MIDSTEFGSITVGGRTYYSDVLIDWNGRVEEVKLQTRHLFDEPDFSKIKERRPEILIVGTGQSGLVEVSEKVKKTCEELGIELKEAPSKEAIELFNEALREGKKAIAFIHVTC